MSASPSPDGRYLLIDERHHPYSYLLPFPMFPERTLRVQILGAGFAGENQQAPLNVAHFPVHYEMAFSKVR